MIYIQDKHNCCGCAACVQVCPMQCITFDEDEQGFRYPLVERAHCVDCGLCEKVCPVINQNESRKPLKVYAAINPNEKIRMKSSSGGIFTMLAEAIIDEGGVVFGARFNENWEVIHDYTETKEGLEAFRGSKYVQSRIGETYLQTRLFLKKGRRVLFSGTSCQIAGLKRFLRKEFDSLLTIDVICHGVPSPRIWREYLGTLALKDKGIQNIKMKDKLKSWRNYSFKIEGNDGSSLFLEPSYTNNYILGFTNNLTLRPSCFQCTAKNGKCCSDITIGDFWGIEKIMPKMDDDKGVSLILSNTEKGQNILKRLAISYSDTEYDACIPYNACIASSTNEPHNVFHFWEEYDKIGINVLLHIRPAKTPFIKRIIKRIIRH